MEIKHIHKRTAIIVLILSVIHLLIFNLNNIGMGLWIVLLVNVSFHGVYYFLSLVPPAQVRRLNHRNKVMGKIYKTLTLFMGIMAVFGAVAATGILVFDVFKSGEYERLIAVCMMAGLFLGGLQLFKNLEAEY